MATVIFSNAGDTDTAVLRFIWRGIPNVKVVEVNKQTANAQELVDQAIEAEHDTLICCGHGTAMGLFNPAGTGYSFLINRQNYKKIKVNRFIGVWCHASEYGESVHLKGFYSSMFISNKQEAEMNHCYKASAKAITDQEILFCLRLNELIREYVPMKKWVGLLNEAGDKSIDVVEFNYDGLKYLTKFEGTVPEYNAYGYQSYSYGHWSTELGRYVYPSEEASLDYYKKTYGAGSTKKEEPKKEAAKKGKKKKTSPQLETDWWEDDADWSSDRWLK
jgi:hypothetical protein